jgi:hypothetical protein
MEQRTLRLGDIVDDYCPRERRITNHAIVALVGEEIRQTRCTTCDGEHVYKQARPPKRIGPRGVTADGGPPDSGPGQLVPRAAAATDPAAKPAEAAANGNAAEASAPEEPNGNGGGNGHGEGVGEVDGWLAHRPLIRASLPRTEGEPPAPRPIPEFTMHQRQPQGRPFRFGQGRHGGGGPASGFGSSFGHDRHGNGRPGDGNGNGNGPSQPGPGGAGRRRRRRGGRHKRSPQ